MTREEREERISEIERQQFLLAMKDRWDSADHDLDRHLEAELKALKEEQDA